MATRTSQILAELKTRLETTFPLLDIRFGLVDAIADSQNAVISIIPTTEILEYQISARYSSILQIDIAIMNRSDTPVFDCEAMRETAHLAIVAVPNNLNGLCIQIRHTQTNWAYADGSRPIAELKATYEIKYIQDYKTLN